MIKFVPIVLGIYAATALPFAAHADSIDNWKVIFSEGPASRKKTCLMTSKTLTMQDGQTGTPVYLIYNGNIFFAKTHSNIDISYSGTGLKIDGHTQHPISVLYRKTNAAFTSHPLKIRNEFITGLDAELTLGFWPSWPKTSSFSVHFDLREFSNTYKRFLNCTIDGSID